MSPSDTRRSRGAWLVLVGIGLAPLVLNGVMLVVTSVVLGHSHTSEAAARVQHWLGWMSLVHALLVLPVVLGTFWLTRGWTALSFGARVLAVAFAGLWVSLDVRRFLAGAEPAMSVTLTYVRAVSSPTLYAALAAVCTSLAFGLAAPRLARLAQVTNLVCILNVVATIGTVAITVPPLLVIVFGASCWLLIVATVWQTGRARSAPVA